MTSQVLFLCTGNSCRSQMAEAIVNSRFNDSWQAYSAGTKPAGYVHPNALLALEGITIPTGDGIVEESADQTIRNMGFVTNPGMSQTDDAIIEVMTHQHP